MTTLREWPAWALPPGLSPGEILWTDIALLRAPQQNSARVLGDVRRLLETERPLGGAEREFLDVSRAFLEASPEASDAVWSDPSAYRWTRVAHRLLGPCLAAEASATAALSDHLGQFGAFPLALALRTGAPLSFETPLRVSLPFAIPATRWSIDGTGSADISGTVEGRLRGTHGGEAFSLALAPGERAPSSDLTVSRCPVACHDGYELPLHPQAFRVPGVDVGEAALRAGLEYQERHADLLRRAVSAVARHAPSVFAQLRLVVRLCALKPRRWGSFDDFSLPELPGSFVASVVQNPLDLADHLIHEFQHNRLSIVEESGPLFEGGEHEPAWYSPWRDKPRGLYGIYHGVFVFVAVCRFWLAVHEAPDVSGDDHAYAVDRLLRLPRQLRLAVGVLDRHARLTPLGRTLLGRLSKDVDEVFERTARAGLPDDAPALLALEEGGYAPETSALGGRPTSVLDSLREHLRRNDPDGRFADLLGDAVVAGEGR